MRRLIVPPEMSRRIGACGLTRDGLLRLFGGLRGDLTPNYALYRWLRHPNDDRLFLFDLAFADGGRMHRFTFHVDDSTSPDHLILQDLEHDARPLPG